MQKVMYNMTSSLIMVVIHMERDLIPSREWHCGLREICELNRVYLDVLTLCITVIRRGVLSILRANTKLAQRPTTLPSMLPPFILSLSIFSHYPSLSNRSHNPRMISSSNQMYIKKVGRHSLARKSAMSTSLCTSQWIKNPRSLDLGTIMARGFSYMYISPRSAVCIAVKSMKKK